MFNVSPSDTTTLLFSISDLINCGRKAKVFAFPIILISGYLEIKASILPLWSGSK